MITIPKELKSKLEGKEHLLEESILTLKEEAKVDLAISLEKYFDETPQEELDKEWEELKHWDEIGPDASEYIEHYRGFKETVYTCDNCPYNGDLMCCHNCPNF